MRRHGKFLHHGCNFFIYRGGAELARAVFGILAFIIKIIAANRLNQNRRQRFVAKDAASQFLALISGSSRASSPAAKISPRALSSSARLAARPRRREDPPVLLLTKKLDRALKVPCSPLWGNWQKIPNRLWEAGPAKNLFGRGLAERKK